MRRRTSISLNEQLLEELKELAKRTNKPISRIVEEAVRGVLRSMCNK